MDLLELYGRASEWTLTKVNGAEHQLTASTPCEGWDVRTLLNHMLETQHYFTAAASGRSANPPGPEPPDLLGDEPVGDFRQARSDLLQVFEQEGVVEQSGPMLGIAFADQLLHGHDLARATGQDATMPDGLAEAAYGSIHGRFTDEQRKGIFGPELPVAEGASPQERLLAYTGRDPSA